MQGDTAATYIGSRDAGSMVHGGEDVPPPLPPPRTRLREICDAIGRLCGDDGGPGAAITEVAVCARAGGQRQNQGRWRQGDVSVGPEMLRQRAAQLLAVADELAMIHTTPRPAAVAATAAATAAARSAAPVPRHVSFGACSSTATAGTATALKASKHVVRQRGGGGSMGYRVASAFLVFAVTLPYYICVTYTSWFVDEGFAIYRNPDARGETPWREVLHHDFWGTSLTPPEGYNTHKSFRPLITLSYAVEWQLAAKFGLQGREMQPMRFLSCAIHTANSLGTLAVLWRLRVPAPWAALGALLFAAHPVHIENIVYIVGRADALATTFYILALLLYLHWALPSSGSPISRARPRFPVWGYVVLVALTAASGLCKETGFTVLAYLACVEVVLRGRWRHVMGLLGAFAFVGGVRTWYVGGTEAGFGYIDTPIRYQDSKLTRTLSYLYQHAYYAKLLVLPWHQSWDYSYDAFPMLESFRDVRLAMVLAAYLSVCALAAHGLRLSVAGRPGLILGLGLVLIPFLPATNLFFLVGTTVGERLLYPSTVGWAMIVVSLPPPRVKVAARLTRLYRVIVVGLSMVYVWNSNVRMSHWRGPAELFGQDAQHWSRSAKVLHSQGSELQALGDLHGALDAYNRSLQIFDDTAITDYCIARILINLGRFQEAYARFDKILAGHGIGLHDGNDFLWMTDLGYTLVHLGANEQGIHYLEEGLQRMPHNCFAWNALGVAQCRLGKLPEAVQSLRQGLECDPDSPSMWINLAVVYAYGSAAQLANEALQHAVSANATHRAVAHNARVLMGHAPAGTQPELDLYIPLPGRR